MSTLDSLLNKLQAMNDAADSLTRALYRLGGPDMGEVGQLRSRLANLSREHLAYEHQLLSKLTGEVRARVPAYHDIVQSTQDLRFAYSAHVQRWSNKAIEADRPGYVAAAGKLIGQLKQHAALVEVKLYRPAFAALSASHPSPAPGLSAVV